MPTSNLRLPNGVKKVSHSLKILEFRTDDLLGELEFIIKGGSDDIDLLAKQLAKLGWTNNRSSGQKDGITWKILHVVMPGRPKIGFFLLKFGANHWFKAMQVKMNFGEMTF